MPGRRAARQHDVLAGRGRVAERVSTGLRRIVDDPDLDTHRLKLLAACRAGPYVGSRINAWRTPSPSIPPSPREAPNSCHSRGLAPALCSCAISPPGARSNESEKPALPVTVTPARPRIDWSTGSNSMLDRRAAAAPHRSGPAAHRRRLARAGSGSSRAARTASR